MAEMKIKNFIFSTPAIVLAPGAISQPMALILNPFQGRRFKLKNIIWNVDLGIPAGPLRPPIPLEQNDIVFYETTILNRPDAGIANLHDLGNRILPLAVYANDTGTELRLRQPGQYDLEIEAANYLTVTTAIINHGTVTVSISMNYIIQIIEGDLL